MLRVFTGSLPYEGKESETTSWLGKKHGLISNACTECRKRDGYRWAMYLSSLGSSPAPRSTECHPRSNTRSVADPGRKLRSLSSRSVLFLGCL